MPQTLAAGTLLNGRYKIQKLLLEREGGAKYLVLDAKVTDRLWIAEEFFPGSCNFESLSKELEVIKTFRHPHLIQTLDFFVDANRLYVIRDYVEGLSLDSILELSPERMAESQVLEWAIQVLDVLIYLNDLSVPYHLTHLNPKSMIVDRDGRLKLGGYSFDDPFPGFEAPELAGDKQASSSSDLYAAAAIFYFLLTLKTPEYPLTPIQILNPSVSESTRTLLALLLHPDPEKRSIRLADVRKAFYEKLHPVVAVPVELTAREKIIDSIRQWGYYLKIVGVELQRRPYVIVLILLSAGVLLYHQWLPMMGKTFHKSSPLIYVAQRHGVLVLDAISGKRKHYFSTLNADRGLLLSSDNQDLWLISEKGKVVDLNPSDGTLRHDYNLHQEIGGSILSSSGLLYLSLSRENIVATVAPNSGRQLAVGAVASHPEKITFSLKQQELYISHKSAPVITVYDLANNSIKRQWSMPSIPSDLAVTPDGQWLLVTFQDSSEMKVFDLAAKGESTSMTLEAPGPYHFFVSKQVVGVTALEGNKIFLYEPMNGFRKTTLTISKPVDAVFLKGDREILVLTDRATVEKLDVDTGRITHQIRAAKGISFVYVP